MLIEFKLRNYKCFRDQQTISLVASTQKELLENTTSHPAFGDRRLLRSAVLYGANASGKSTLIQAVNFCRDFVLNSAKSRPESLIPVQSFLLSPETADQPSEFEMTFLHNDVRHQYGFAADRRRVHEEWLLSYPQGSARTLFERTPTDNSSESEWYFGPSLTGEKVKLTKLTRPDALLLSVAAQFNHEQLSDIYHWFEKGLQAIDGQHTDPDFLEHMTTSMLAQAENEWLRAAVRALLQSAGVGISDFEIKREKRSAPDLPADMPDKIKDAFAVLLSLPGSAELAKVRFLHRLIGRDTQLIPFEPDMESMGTRRFYGFLGPVMTALANGSLLAVDELDSSLHPMLVRRLVDLFNNQQTNPKNAQLLFNTHDTTLLDVSILRRDQVWFTEKDHDGVAYIYPLLDFKPRKGEALSKGYLQGRYGAIPITGNPQGLVGWVKNGANS